MAAQHFHQRSLHRAMEVVLNSEMMCGSQEQALVEAMQEIQVVLSTHQVQAASPSTPAAQKDHPRRTCTSVKKVFRQTPRPLSIFS